MRNHAALTGREWGGGAADFSYLAPPRVIEGKGMSFARLWERIPFCSSHLETEIPLQTSKAIGRNWLFKLPSRCGWMQCNVPDSGPGSLHICPPLPSPPFPTPPHPPFPFPSLPLPSLPHPSSPLPFPSPPFPSLDLGFHSWQPIPGNQFHGNPKMRSPLHPAGLKVFREFQAQES